METYKFLCAARVGLGYPAPPVSAVMAGAGAAREMVTFQAKAWPKVVGCATLVVDSQEPILSADRAFPEVGALRRSGRLLCELTNRALVPAYYRTGVPDGLLQCCVAHALFVGCTDVVSVVPPWERDGFARLGFRPMGPIRSSGGAIPEPAALVRLDLRPLRGENLDQPSADRPDCAFLRLFYLDRNPFREHVRGWATASDEALRAAA
jgi:hypothetical protein